MAVKKDISSIPNWLLQARSKWTYTGQERPDFAIEPKKGQRSVWDFPRPPALVAVPKLVEVFHQETLLASTRQAMAVEETASPPTFYLPPAAVQWSHLEEVAGKTSLCEWKGSATYWILKDQPQRPVAWSYAKPFPPFEPLTDYLAFYPQFLQCFVNGERVTPQPGGFYAGWITSDIVGPFKGEPGTGHW